MSRRNFRLRTLLSQPAATIFVNNQHLEHYNPVPFHKSLKPARAPAYKTPGWLPVMSHSNLSVTSLILMLATYATDASPLRSYDLPCESRLLPGDGDSLATAEPLGAGGSSGRGGTGGGGGGCAGCSGAAPAAADPDAVVLAGLQQCWNRAGGQNGAGASVFFSSHALL